MSSRSSNIPVQQQQPAVATLNPSTAPSSSSGKTFSSSEEFVADPLPFDYNEFSAAAAAGDMSGRDIISMAHNVIGDDNTRVPRRLPEPKSIREHYPPNLQPYGMQQHAHHASMHYPVAHHHHQHHQHAQQLPSYGLHGGHHHMMYNSSPLQNIPTSHSFQAMLDHHSARKDVHMQQQQQQQQQQQHSQQQHPGMAPPQHQGHFQQHYNMPYINTHNAPTPQQEVSIKLKTQLKAKYWRNGRRNLQCFPNCKVFGDYSYIKIDDLKQHDFMWGKCRGSLVAEIALNGSFSFEDLVILARVHSLENIPVPFEEAVVGECMIGRIVASDIMEIMKEQWISGERLPDFMHQSTRAACFEFKPKVWKYSEDMSHGKCKRRNVRYYVQFEAFVPVFQGDVRSYMCVGSGMSTSFEVGSSRVLARQKRKAAGRSSESAKKIKTLDEDAAVPVLSTKEEPEPEVEPPVVVAADP